MWGLMMNIILNNYINEYGNNAIWDTEKLYEYLLQNKVDKKYTYQLSLTINSGDIKDIVDRSVNRISSVMLNTAIINTVKNTGLRQNVVQDVLSDIFTALHISYDRQTLFGFDTETGESIVVSKSLSPDNIEKKLRTAQKLLSDNDESGISEAVNIYEELSKSGSAEAMYMLGMLKKRELIGETNRLYNRVLTAEEKSKEQKNIRCLFETAASNGFVKAKAELGDIYYEERDYDKAYEYYSAPGVVTVKNDTKDRIVSILNQRISNVLAMILGGALLVCMWMFLFLNLKSVHNGNALFGWAIPINILASLIFGYMCVRIQKYRYRNSKIYVFVMLLVWLIYPLILAIN